MADYYVKTIGTILGHDNFEKGDTIHVSGKDYHVHSSYNDKIETSPIQVINVDVDDDGKEYIEILDLETGGIINELV